MANNAFLKAVRAANYCCPYAFFLRNNRLAAWELAEILSVSERTIKSWRRLYRAKEMKCGHYRQQVFCIKASQPRSHA